MSHNVKNDRTGLLTLFGLGVLSLILSGAITYVSQGFSYGHWETAGVWVYIALSALMGGVLLGLWAILPRLRPSLNALKFIFAIGLITRLMMFASNPVIEDLSLIHI